MNGDTNETPNSPTEVQFFHGPTFDRGECEWKEDEDGNWDTACGDKHILNVGTPKENHFQYCCYCGKRLIETKFPSTHRE